MRMPRFNIIKTKAIIKHAIGPLLFSIYPSIFLYTHNIEMLSLRQLARPLLFASILAGLVFSASKLVLKENGKASLAATLFLIMFWNYDSLFNGIHHILDLNHWHILPLLLFIYGHLVYFINALRKRSIFENLNKAALAMASALIAFNLIALIPAEVHKHQRRSKKSTYQKVSQKTSRPGTYPDIYLIILDEYARLDTIKEEWGYDNDEFSDFIIDKGFFVADKSESKYAYTELVIPSIMDLNYVDKDLTTIELYQIINNSFLFAYLDKMGYKIVFLDGCSRAEHELRNKNVAHQYIIDLTKEEAPRFDEFSDLVIKKTFLGPVVTAGNSANLWYTVSNYFLNFLADFPSQARKINQPFLVFAHLPCPHLPYVFNSDGDFHENPTNYWEYMSLDKDVLKSLYLEQYIYVTKRITAIVNGILETSINEPVIILMSDHGPRKESAGIDNETQKYRVLNAVYFPDGDYAGLYATIAPVNTLRVIMNKYFGEHYKMLEDR
ncbi:MAG: hypothetical protein ACYDH0_07820 [Candidatus Aminicenantales bacterium]